MKLIRLNLLLLLLLIVGSGITLAQTVTPNPYPTGSSLRVKEADGSPNAIPVTTIVFPNGSLTRNGSSVTVAFGSGSGTVTNTAGALTANAIALGNGGADIKTTAAGTGVVTALGVNVGSAGAFVIFDGALGTPTSGTVTNLTGTASININGTVGATTPASGAFTTLTASGATTLGSTLTLTSTTAANNKITQGAAINIGTTSTDGIILQNTTAAGAGAQQYSPRLRLTGQGWKTNATAASQTVDWLIEARPVQGAANPTVNLALLYQVNGGGFTDAIATGQILVPGGGSSSQATAQIAGVNNTSNGILFGGGNAGNAVSIRVNGSAVFSADANVGSSVAGIPVTLDFLGIPNFHSGRQARITSPSNDLIRIGDRNGSGAGSLVLGTSTVGSIGTSGVGVLAIANGTAPTSSPADEFQLYSADGAAGAAEAYIRNEAGELNRLSGLGARNSSSFAKTSDTTLANITGLTRNVEAARVYAFTAVLQSTAAATGGVKFAVSGTATATSISYEGVLVDSGAIVNQTRATALDTAVCASTTSTAGTCTIRGVILVANAGTLTIQFAQNASDGGASTVLVNQYMQLIPIS